MTAENKPLVSTGSMLNTSEGLITTAVLGTLTTVATTAADWRTQSAASLGIALVGAVYVYCRSKAKGGAA